MFPPGCQYLHEERPAIEDPLPRLRSSPRKRLLRLAREFLFGGKRRAGRTARESPEFCEPRSEDEGSLARSRGHVA